jgi:hypothetical protein
MITVDPPEAYGYTMFCDDIRQEVGGKISYIGAYGGRVLVHGNFPFTMPKLALGIVYLQQHDKVVWPIRFWIFLPGDAEDKPSIIAEMPQEAIQPAINNAESLAAKFGSEIAFATIYSQFGFAPCVIQQPGILKVRAVRGDRLIRLGSLEIIQAPAEPTDLAPPQP